MTIELPRLVDVEIADVYKQGRLAATLTRTAEGLTFRYLDDYLAGEGFPVATTLPKTEAVVRTPAGAAPPFFAGLLPEGRRLTALRRNIKTSADDDLSILLAVGSDLIGDVQVFPHGEMPAAAAPVLLGDFAEISFKEVFAQVVGSEPDRVGLPGVQEKVSARMISVPLTSQSQHFILKLNPPEFHHLVENEAFFLRAARLCGLNVVEATLVSDKDGEPGLLISRFDRPPTGRRLAVEDGCQVLGRYPADKYAIPTATLIRALSELCRARPVAARDLLRQCIFAYLSGNGDAHAKNFAILQLPDGEWRVTAAYDLPSSQPYPSVDATMALSVNSKRGDELSGKDFVTVGEGAGVPAKATRQVIGEVCERADLWLADVMDLPYDSGRLRKLRRFIDMRRSRLLRF